MKNKISISLSSEEALILYDWLSRFNEREEYDFEDQSQERVLWDLESSLEKELPVFNEDYKLLLEKAKDKIRDRE